jgi:hypothetical protein
LKTLQSNLTAALCSVALFGLVSVAVTAQTMPSQTVTPPTYNDPYCGSVQNGMWVPTGTCNTVTNVGPYSRVDGTIIAVRGHLVTLQQANRNLVINDRPALDMEDTGRVAVGRSVEALGYWHNGVFFATSFTSAPGM